MHQLLQPNFRGRAGDLARDFAAAQPFRHIVVDDFLNPQFCQRLIEEFPAFDVRKAINELDVAERKAAVPQILRISAAYKEFRSPEFPICSMMRIMWAAARTKISTGRIWTCMSISTTIPSGCSTGV